MYGRIHNNMTQDTSVSLKSNIEIARIRSDFDDHTLKSKDKILLEPECGYHIKEQNN
jgi:hypothetical protein